MKIAHGVGPIREVYFSYSATPESGAHASPLIVWGVATGMCV
jgi:hypothetical protein